MITFTHSLVSLAQSIDAGELCVYVTVSKFQFFYGTETFFAFYEVLSDHIYTLRLTMK